MAGYSADKPILHQDIKKIKKPLITRHIHVHITRLVASYAGGERSGLLVFLISEQHGSNYIRKIAKHDGSHGAYVIGSTFEP